MPAIHVRDVPEAVAAALRERAARHGQSMQKEIRQILEAAAAERPAPDAVDHLRLHKVSVGGSQTWSREEIYGDSGR